MRTKPPTTGTKSAPESSSTSIKSTRAPRSSAARFAHQMEYLGLYLTIKFKVSLPFGFSPAASMKLAHSDGELATSRAAAKYGLCMGLSSYSNYALEDVAAQGAGNPYVMQMCVLRDRSITIQLLERAESMILSQFSSSSTKLTCFL